MLRNVRLQPVNLIDRDIKRCYDSTKRLDEIVRSTKARKDIGVKYMKSWERERELLETGKAEGIEEGRAEGIEEGRAAGIKEGRAEGGDLRDAQRIEDMLRRGKTAEEIIDFCGYPDELVKRIETEMRANA